MMLHACSALRLFIYCLCVQRFQTMMLYKHAHIYAVKMGDGSAQFLGIFAICRKTELSDNENEVNRPHLASASGMESVSAVLVVELPQAIPIQIENYYRQSIQYYTQQIMKHNTLHIVHMHTHTRVEKMGEEEEERRQGTSIEI